MIGEYEYDGKYHGVSLAKAIFDSSSYNPRVVDDWISDQAKMYLESDYDAEWIEKNIDSFEKEYALCKVIESKGYDPDLLCDSGLTLSEMASWNDSLVNEFLNYVRIRESKRDDFAYQCASDDFDCFWSDVDEENDEAVAEFFGIPGKITGWKDDYNVEHSLSECWLCPYCKQPNEVKKCEEVWRDNNNEYEEVYPTSEISCADCRSSYLWADKSILSLNKHLDESWIVSRMI
jgi:hypothetical protein